MIMFHGCHVLIVSVTYSQGDISVSEIHAIKRLCADVLSLSGTVDHSTETTAIGRRLLLALDHFNYN